MPELPEVETIRRDLNKKILGKKIEKVKVSKRRLVKNNLNNFYATIKGNSIQNIHRIGKLLIFELAKEKKFLLIHLKMTGQLVYKNKKEITAGGHSLRGENLKEQAGGDLPNKYSHVIFSFEDGTELFFNDMRQFGYLRIVDEKKLLEIKKDYGPEPLDKNFKLSKLEKIFANRRSNVKSILLNQKLISGIGNIYADEILFSAKVRPDRISGGLTKQEIKNIFLSSKKIIKKAIKNRGTTFSDYVDSQGREGNFSKFLLVYGKEGEKCSRCKNIIIKTKTAGRGTRYCKNCQK